MQQETLFLAVSLLDRFQAASPAVRFLFVSPFFFDLSRTTPQSFSFGNKA
jgi:hypothetical protein